MNVHPYQKEINQWLNKANGDLGSAKILIRSKRATPWVICFHSQQAVEKILKALLLNQTNRYPKGHSLLILEEVLQDTGLNTSAIHKSLIILNPYYVGTRYPGTKEYEITKQQAVEAIAQADKVKKFVLKLLK